MKKYYQSKKFTEFNLKRRDKENLRRLRLRQKYGFFGASSKTESFLRHTYTVTFPEIFSLLHNLDETLNCYNSILGAVEHHKNVYIDLEKIKVITPDALLYLLLIIEKVPMKRSFTLIGNSPKDQAVKRLFQCSGFYKYVQSSNTHQCSDDILAVETGDQVDSEIAGKVVKFARDKLQLTDKALTRQVYAIILEAMINVIEHAYPEKHRPGKFSRWWLMAIYNKEKQKVHFALVDNGETIPKTVQKKVLEGVFSDDAKLLHSTMLGENRSSTGLAYRGRGLPRVREYAERKQIENLFILSGKAAFKIDVQECTIKSPFVGTLLAWDFCKEVTYAEESA